VSTSSPSLSERPPSDRIPDDNCVEIDTRKDNPMGRLLNLTGARIILTGASSGIGHALALRLADQKARLVLASRNAARLEALAATIRQKGGEAISVPTDVAEAGQRRNLVEQAVAALGGLDILINNAGVGAMGWFLDASEER